MATLAVKYRCDGTQRRDRRSTAELAQRSFHDYVPCAQFGAALGSPGEYAPSGSADQVARTVTDAMLASPSLRRPPRRSALGEEEAELVERRDRYIAAQNRVEIERRVLPCISKGEPIPALMVWSPKKHWVSGEDSAVDVAELVALQTFFDLHVAVRHVYAPGLHFHLRVEDIEHAFIHSREPGLEADMERYISRLSTAVRVLGLEQVFTVARVTSLARDAGEIAAWQSHLEQNFAALRAYWHESEQRGWEAFEQYDTYKSLAALGWQGPIPREMRDFYLARIQRGLGRTEPGADAAEMVMRNLAGILLHAQEKLLRVGDNPRPIVLSFMPQPPGTLLHFMFGRLSLAFVPRRLSSSANCAAPWSVKGCLRERKGKLLPTFTSWHQPLGQFAESVPGVLELARGDEHVIVRADLLSHSPDEKSARGQKPARVGV